MKNSSILYLIFILFILSSCNNRDSSQQLIAINSLSYTSVVYNSIKDTVLVSTYSGRIAKRIRNKNKEEVLIQLDDEVYCLQYSYGRKVVMASTLKSGIIFIDVFTGKIKKQLEVKNGAWINSILLSKDENYLIGVDVKGNNHIWDLNNNYKKLDSTKGFQSGYIRYIDNSGVFYYQVKDKYLKWNHIDKKIEKEYEINGRLVDINLNDDLLFLNFNEFEKFSNRADSIVFRRKHPYYIYKEKNGDTVHRNYLQLQYLV